MKGIAVMYGERGPMNQKSEPKVTQALRGLMLIVSMGLPLLVVLILMQQQMTHQVWSLDTTWMWTLHQHATPLLDDLAVVLAHVGGLPGSLALCVLVSLCASLIWRWAVVQMQLVFLWIAMFGAAGWSWALKYVIDRPRPALWPLIAPEYGTSFPSGHSAYAAALAGVLIVCGWQWGRRLRWLAVFIALSWAGLMGVSRVYLGAHYPTDVLAGWALGGWWVAVLSGNSYTEEQD